MFRKKEYLREHLCVCVILFNQFFDVILQLIVAPFAVNKLCNQHRVFVIQVLDNLGHVKMAILIQDVYHFSDVHV